MGRELGALWEEGWQTYFICDLQARLCRAIVDVWDNECDPGGDPGATKGKSEDS